MLGAVLALALISGSAPGTDPCAGVVDATPACAAPARVEARIAPDEKKQPAPIPGIDPAKLPGELGFFSLGLAIGGGAALAWSLSSSPSTDDERLWHDVTVWSGAGLLGWSGLAAAGAFALWVFDPSTGEMRPKIFGERE
jgi:hypothetical protein